MTVYVLIALIIGVLGIAIEEFSDDDASSRWLFIGALIILATVMGFRAQTVGIDTAPYCDYYSRIGASSDYMNIVTSAPVYSLYNRLLFQVSPDPQVMIFTSSAIIMACVGYFIWVFSDNKMFSLFLFVTLYFYFNCFNGMRQGIAMSLCLLAYSLFYKRKLIVVALGIFALAVGVHNTSIVMLPFMFLGMRTYKETTFRFLLSVVAALSLGLLLVFDSIIELFIQLYPGYAHYAEPLVGGQFATNGRNVLKTLFYAVVLIAAYRCFFPKKGYTSEEEIHLLQAIMLPAVLGVCLALVFYGNYLICERIAQYMTVFIVVVIPDFVARAQSYEMIAKVVCTGASLALLGFLLAGNYAGIVPYSLF